MSTGDLAKTKSLIESGGADPNFVGPTGWNALHWAVQMREEKVVRYLLEAGADCSVTSVSKHTALQKACMLGDAKMVRMLVEIGKADVRTQVDGANSNRDTALHLAAAFGHSKTMSFLRDHGAEVFATDARGQTARNRALSMGMFECADQLSLWEAEMRESRLLSRIEDRFRKALHRMDDEKMPSLPNDEPRPWMGIGAGKVVSWSVDAPIIGEELQGTPSWVDDTSALTQSPSGEDRR